MATHCKHGHAWTTENTYHSPKGNKACRACNNRRSKVYRSQNLVARTALALQYRMADPKAHSDRNRKWSAENRDLVNAKTRRHRARKADQYGQWAIPERTWLPFLYEVDPKCYYCRVPFHGIYTVEHKIPLSRPELCPLGKKLHEPWNIRLACGRCNSSKRDNTVAEWNGRAA